ncbi:MAG: hypothetical protein FJ298_15915 [Planctomycetes bacterium]|nr:hypothetical protein [Planctomycetota bacterium]
MSYPVTVTIAPEPTRVRILATQDRHDILKAVLAPTSVAHPRAAATLLEGLSLWYQQTLGVVLCADDRVPSFGSGLCDELGFGTRKLHFEVGIAEHARCRRRGRVHGGLGDFRDLRELSVGSGWLR